MTDNEVKAFYRLFEGVPEGEFGNVQRLFKPGQAGCGRFRVLRRSGWPACADRARKTAKCSATFSTGSFNIATADGFLHEREQAFLARVAEIFDIDQEHFDAILRRHVDAGSEDPYRILKVSRGTRVSTRNSPGIIDGWSSKTIPTG